MPLVSPVCSSGECRWPSYGSLALCSSVFNLTEAKNETLLDILRDTASKRLAVVFNITIAMLFDLEHQVGVVPPSFPVIIGPVETPTGAFNDSVTELLFTDHYIAYSDTLLNDTTISDVSQLKFLEIGFFWCTKTLSTEVKKGIPSTVELSSTARAVKSSPLSLNFGWSPILYQCYLAGTCNQTLGGIEVELEAPAGQLGTERFVVDAWTSLMSSAMLFGTLYDSILIGALRGLVISSGGGIGQAFVPSLFGDFMSTTVPPPESQMENVCNIAANMAQSITNLSVFLPHPVRPSAPSPHTHSLPFFPYFRC